MKNRLLPLALCASLAFTLASCGSKDPEPTPTPDPTPSVNVVTPTPEVQPTESVNVITPTPEAAPTESTNMVTPPEETENPVKPVDTETPASTPEPTPEPTPEATPAATPTPEATPEADPDPDQAPSDDLTAAQVYEKLSAVAGGNGMSDMGFVLEEFYNLSTEDLEDFAFYMPEMSATTEELFIAKVKSGKMDGVKAACESRQQGLKEEGAFYPATAAYVENSRVVVNGDWIILAVVEFPDEVESAFYDCTK